MRSPLTSTPSRWSSLVRNAGTALLAPLMAHSAAIAAQAPAATPARGATPDNPNIVFILADDLGYGDLGCYGQTQIQTPNLDRLAREGVRFTQFYTGAPVCAPARNSLMTGQHSGHALIRGNAKINLRPEDRTIPEVLKPAGYTSGLIGKWGLGSEGSEGAPTRKGFDYFFGYVDQTMAHNYYPTYLVRNETRVPLRNVVPNPGPYNQGVASVKVDYSADLMADDSLKFIHDHRDGKFFLYFAPTLPHANDEAKPDGMEVPDYGPYASKDWPTPMKGYAAMVTRLDTEVGRIMEQLKKDGLDGSTIVFFASDNGSHAEGGYDPEFFNSSGGLRGKKRDVYEGGIREPMIVRWPSHTKPGTTSDHVGYFPDVLPTLAQLAGVKPPSGGDGISFVPAILGDTRTQAQHEYVYWEFYEPRSELSPGAWPQAVRFGDWKAIRSPMLTGKIELYNLANDRAEQHDVAAQHPDLVERARTYMEQAHVDSPRWKPGAAVNAPAKANP